ncbi:MAG: flagellar motor protein MotB [Deltaproteobacteria bacterium]|nr:flagellar motor protein MotB [Deltaproteobacteria bacterium]
MSRNNKSPLYIDIPKTDGWMTTFSDMVTLLITFFVLLISMSSMDEKAFREVFGFFNDALGPLEFSDQQGGAELLTLPDPIPENKTLDAATLNGHLLHALEEEELRGISGNGINPIEVRESSRGFVIKVSSDILFDSGSDRLKNDALPVLYSIANTLKETDSFISIDGHTDAMGSQEVNRTLSLKRAERVLNYFIYSAGMSPIRFGIAGYGSTRPVAGNSVEEDMAKNRRVEIVLLKYRM